jgi:hypothetical protein
MKMVKIQHGKPLDMRYHQLMRKQQMPPKRDPLKKGL